jgi:hypothetical protein
MILRGIPPTETQRVKGRAAHGVHGGRILHQTLMQRVFLVFLAACALKPSPCALRAGLFLSTKFQILKIVNPNFTPVYFPDIGKLTLCFCLEFRVAKLQEWLLPTDQSLDMLPMAIMVISGKEYSGFSPPGFLSERH